MTVDHTTMAHGGRLRSGLYAIASAWWQVLFLAAQIVVLGLSPSSYQGHLQRLRLLHSLHQATGPLLSGYLLLTTLLSLVLIRIVVATALSYGLSQYALEVLVRTLVLELVPLHAALFVALRYSLPDAHRLRERLHGRRDDEQVLLRSELLPRALAAAFAVLLFATLSGVLAMAMTYLMLYGLSPWGLPPFTHGLGRIFSPVLALIFSLKTLFFSLAVAIVPMAATAQRDGHGSYRRGNDIGEFARLLSVLLSIEMLSLIGNYY